MPWFGQKTTFRIKPILQHRGTETSATLQQWMMSKHLTTQMIAVVVRQDTEIGVYRFFKMPVSALAQSPHLVFHTVQRRCRDIATVGFHKCTVFLIFFLLRFAEVLMLREAKAMFTIKFKSIIKSANHRMRDTRSLHFSETGRTDRP